MTKLQYSAEAHNVLPKFYNKTYLVYVEGKEDTVFWKKIFDIANVNDVKFEEVGGCDQLNSKCDMICDNNCKILVARDLDHGNYTESKYNNPRIIYTYGYSIENTLFCEINLDRVMQDLYLVTRSFSFEISEYVKYLEKTMLRLLVYDIANHKYKKGIEIFGDSCYKFLNKNDEYNISKIKKANFISRIRKSFNMQEIKEIISLLKKENRKRIYLIKGHFLNQIIFNFIKYKISKLIGNREVKLSNDTFFSILLGGCQICYSKNCSCCSLNLTIQEIRHSINCL
jgi:hypothetical protein